ncbi:2-hydroxyacid dehydrogenase [Methylovulum psychrotolerans]|jgi:lactate dehydrogenase-like 2-hydroxyacid dehydrogenase|uniref:D-glycerate dehydrogenase n=1 Tax=Methylovulum psychrotolerans TaxID=1704499 RepID=A0A1Z4C2S4_9GAMM|nr:D-glycerate dehydrogenase [Methylovulum psychrotolerans]ASF47809.1 D-glycerate dehydrogenase [Methylovulum psychrotolerans]
MNKPKIIVTRRWPAEVETQLKDLYDVQLNESDIPMNAEQLKLAMQTADALLPTVTDPITADIIGVENRRVQIIGNFGVGYNNIDINAAKAHGIAVTNTPHVLTDCTADIAMLLLLMSARRAAEGERLILNGQWTGWGPTQLVGQKVTGKTLGLIGFGRIAQAMARKAHHGFGMKILFYVPSTPDPAIVEELQAVRCHSVEELLTEAHFVSLHCPGGAATKHLLNEQRLKLMRPSAHLINTARGDVVDSNALIKALTEHWIAGAGLDVYEGEPNLNPGFLGLDNVTLLPHLGSASEETRVAMGNRVLNNIAAFFAGTEPPDRVV